MAAIKVHLRKKKLKGKNTRGQFVYQLQFYPPILNDDGSRNHYKSTGLYGYFNPKTPYQREVNREMKKQAEAIRDRTQVEVNKHAALTDDEKEVLRRKEIGKRSFLEFMQAVILKRRIKPKTIAIWSVSRKHLSEFRPNLTFAELTPALLEDFKDYLLTECDITQNSASLYFSKIRTALKEAYKHDYIFEDLNLKVDPIRTTATARQYLTPREMNLMVATPCSDKIIKNAAIFSALTGLRVSDIQKLTWKEVRDEENGCELHFQQQKTSGNQIHPVSESARRVLGKRGKPNARVFELEYSSWVSETIRTWTHKAGIDKDITFHCFRHTYAVHQLLAGTDIYTLSRMLGHTDVQTTQIYAHIADKMKREAADRLSLNLDQYLNQID